MIVSFPHREARIQADMIPDLSERRSELGQSSSRNVH
jgi:hypothetical protein